MVSLCLAIIFGLVGLVFLFFPDQVLVFFNLLSRALGFPEAPLPGFHFYLALAAGYMYLVALLALMTFARPTDKTCPFLLAHGKIATSLLSFGLFLFHQPYLIYLTNFIVDGLIGVSVIFLFLGTKSRSS